MLMGLSHLGISRNSGIGEGLIREWDQRYRQVIMILRILWVALMKRNNVQSQVINTFL